VSPSALLASQLSALLFGIKWMDPNWLLDQFGTAFFWVSLVIIFVECGLFFPFLPGDTLLVAMGIFLANEKISIIGGGPLVNLGFGLVVMIAAALGGNVAGYEIGRKIGPPLYEHDGRILKREYFTKTEKFFEKHGRKALVIGRFVPFVRTYITVVAGATKMDRRKFIVWSLVGAVTWVASIMLLGYFVGASVPWLAKNVDYLILGLLALSVIPIVIEWWRHRDEDDDESSSGSQKAKSKSS
jgi:membrane-associated protein